MCRDDQMWLVSTNDDATLHFVAYTVAGVLVTLAFRQRGVRIAGLLMLISLGVGSELLQADIPGRSLGIWDMVANVMGACFGFLIQNDQSAVKWIKRPPPSLRLFEATDDDLEKLKRRIDLMSLELRNTQITDAGLAHLKGLTELWTLGLAGTRVTGAGLVHLKPLTNLVHLDLSRTDITDAGLAHLKGLTELHALLLNDTRISDRRTEASQGVDQLVLLVRHWH